MKMASDSFWNGKLGVMPSWYRNYDSCLVNLAEVIDFFEKRRPAAPI
jgi:hypothetical protein